MSKFSGRQHDLCRKQRDYRTTAAKRITASYLELQKTENRRHPDFQNCQRNRLGEPGLQMFTVPIKADVPKSQWYHKRAQ